MKNYRINHLLFPTDFSEISLQALEVAVRIAAQHAATLVLLHVDNEYPGRQRYEMLPVTPPKPAIEPAFSEAGALLRNLATDIRQKEHIDLEYFIAHGHVATEICKTAVQHHADLIVMGTHGASGFREFFIGSQAYSVVKHAPCPVLTVPPDYTWNGFERVLYPLRHVPGAVERYYVLRQLLTPKISVVHLVGLPSHADSMEQIAGDVAELSKTMEKDGVAFVVSMQHKPERVSTEVLNMATAENMDLIAITASQEYDIRNFFTGPYARKIVNHAKTPVLSIRPSGIPTALKQPVKASRADYDQALPDLALGFTRIPVMAED